MFHYAPRGHAGERAGWGMERDPLMTMRQAAEALGLERTAVYRAAYQGRLAVERYGRTMMVRRSEVERYRREKRHAGGRPRRTGRDAPPAG